MSRLRFAALVVAASALSACQDPAGVGLGLIDEEGADPSTRAVFVSSLDTIRATATPIGFANPNDTPHQPRFLIGDVTDPVFGDVEAIAYVDVVQPASVDAEAGDVRQVWLELRRDYVYGDTTTVLPVALRQVNPTPSWSASPSYPADTTFATGDVLATSTLSVAPADTVVRFDLPEAWVTANAATLVGDDFSTAFEGFALEVADGAPAPGAVFGFSTLATRGSLLRIATAEDTLGYALQEVFTSMQREDPVATPPSLLSARAYANGGIRFEVDFGPVGPLPVAQGSLSLPLDRSVAEEGAFVRPIATRSGLFGVREADSLRAFLGEVIVDTSGDARTINTSGLTPTIQQILLGDESYERFEIVPAVSGLAPLIPVSLDILPVLNPTDPEAGPRFTLTVIGQPST
ncbi:MAG: hypothetical protein AAF845_04925 [Bacteroidota bacterium]